MLTTLLEYGMQMKLGAPSVPNLAKFSHWLEQEMFTKLPQIQRNRLLLCVQFLLQGICSTNAHIFRPEIPIQPTRGWCQWCLVWQI